MPALLADIQDLVSAESPSADIAAVTSCGEVLARIGRQRLGVAPERLIVDGRSHLRWRLGDGAGRVLLLGHHDTIWPLGSLAEHPCTVIDGVLRGPGCFDMKTGVIMAIHAAAALPTRRPVTILSTADEEIGSPT